MAKRTFLVTGATKGIGIAISQILADEGHDVIGIAREPLASFPGTVVQIDLDDEVASANTFNDLAKSFSFDGVVNNAGRGSLQRIGEVELERLDDVLRFNLHPALNAVQAILPTLLDKSWGRIVNITSLVTLGMVNRTSYAASKAALQSFTKTWALELAGSGITVNAVSPGPTETELFRKATPIGSDAERAFLARIPMQRFAKPAEIAAAVAFLMSENASYITGQTLYVDGGGSIGKASS